MATPRDAGPRESGGVDGDVAVPPVYAAGVEMAGGRCNVLLVVTRRNHVYAIDVEKSRRLWQVALVGIPEAGVIVRASVDPNAGVLYVLMTGSMGGSGVKTIHVLDLATGAQRVERSVTPRGGQGKEAGGRGRGRT